MSGLLRLPDSWLDQQIVVDVIGAGGTGSQVADQLASLEATLRVLGHPGLRVRIHDGDIVESSNVGRQRFTRHDIGVNKATILTHRINAFYDLEWTADPSYVELHKETYLSSAAADGLVITCVDQATFRAELGKLFRREATNALWLDLGNGDSQAQCVIGHLGVPNSTPRIPNIYDLFPELEAMEQEDDQAPSCSAEEAIARQPWPINRLVATVAMEMLWNLIRSGQSDHHGQFLQTQPFTTSPLPVDETHWAMLGYSPKRSRKKRNKRRS